MEKLVEFFEKNMNKIKKLLYLKIFNENQIREMKFGLLEDIDVKKYAKPYFDERQMREIRYGLEEGIDIEVYAKRHYKSSQMREIRLKL